MLLALSISFVRRTCVINMSMHMMIQTLSEGHGSNLESCNMVTYTTCYPPWVGQIILHKLANITQLYLPVNALAVTWYIPCITTLLVRKMVAMSTHHCCKC